MKMHWHNATRRWFKHGEAYPCIVDRNHSASTLTESSEYKEDDNLILGMKRLWEMSKKKVRSKSFEYYTEDRVMSTLAMVRAQKKS